MPNLLVPLAAMFMTIVCALPTLTAEDHPAAAFMNAFIAGDFARAAPLLDDQFTSNGASTADSLADLQKGCAEARRMLDKGTSITVHAIYTADKTQCPAFPIAGIDEYLSNRIEASLSQQARDALQPNEAIAFFLFKIGDRAPSDGFLVKYHVNAQGVTILAIEH